MNKVLVLGAGGTGQDAVDIINALEAGGVAIECLGYLDDDPAKHGASIGDLEVLGPIDSATSYDAEFVDCLGSPASFRERRARIAATGISPDRFRTLVHPRAVVSPSACLGAGCIVYPMAIIGPGARIGQHVILLSHTVVNHHSRIGDFTVLASSATVSGHVTVGESCYLGAGCTLRDGSRIGPGALVGMGSCVVGDVAADSIVVGNPARPLEH